MDELCLNSQAIAIFGWLAILGPKLCSCDKVRKFYGINDQVEYLA